MHTLTLMLILVIMSMIVTVILYYFLFVSEVNRNMIIQMSFVWWHTSFPYMQDFICIFVCLGFSVPLENFSLIWRRHHYLWRTANFDLYSALMAIEQWGFFNVSHLLRHGPTLYNGHLRGPVTLTPVAELWQRSSHYLFLRLLKVCRGWDSNTQRFACEVKALTDFAPRWYMQDKLYQHAT